MSDENVNGTVGDEQVSAPAPQGQDEAPQTDAEKATDQAESTPQTPEAATEEPASAPADEPAKAASDDEAKPAPAEKDAEQSAQAKEPEEAPQGEKAEQTEPAEASKPAASTPKPSAPPKPPSPAAFAKKPAAVRQAPHVAPSSDPTESMKFGRVGDDGTVYVKDGDEERAVGSYPEKTQQEALAYFARKYDELAAAAELLHQRVSTTDLSAQEAAASLKSLREQIGDAHVVGDLPALRETVAKIETEVSAKQEVAAKERAEAKAKAAEEREKIVVEAETIAAKDPAKIQWKASGNRMRELLEEWKRQQRQGPRLDKPTENPLWQRFSAARNGFDKARRAWFAQLDSANAEAKAEKERLVAEAERLATSKDWGATAGAFKRLMQEWRRAGRAQRKDDDKLWARFKAAQDSFFAAKDEVVAAEEEEFKGNLKVKEELLVEAQALLPVKDLKATKKKLRDIQDRWDAAGKVPRRDLARIEGAMRKVEQAVRDKEDKRWKAQDPERAARAQSFADQLETQVNDLREELAAAEADGDARKIKRAKEALTAKEAWLTQARRGLSEFGG